jgi:hypothetical protein
MLTSQKLTRMDLALHADMTTGEMMAVQIMSIGSMPVNPKKELKFGFPNESMMPSGAYRARWEDKLEIGISPKYDFFIWRSDISEYTGVNRVNCDGLLHALALIHHLLDQHNIPLTQRGNLDAPPNDQ